MSLIISCIEKKPLFKLQLLFHGHTFNLYTVQIEALTVKNIFLRFNLCKIVFALVSHIQPMLVLLRVQ